MKFTYIVDADWKKKTKKNKKSKKNRPENKP